MMRELLHRAGHALAAIVVAAIMAAWLSSSIEQAAAQSYLVDNVKMSVSGAPGTGTITLGSAVAGAQSASTAGIPNGAIVSYFINDGGSNWEIGHGTYSTTGPTLTRGALWSSDGVDAAISLDSAAIVSLTVLAEDLAFSSDTSQSGTSYTLALADCNSTVHFTNSSAVTVTIPATLPAKCNIGVEQDGAGQVKVNGTAVSAATLHSAHGYTGTYAQWAAILLKVISNSGGSSAIVDLFGDGA